MIDDFEDGGELFDGRAIDRTDRTSHAYKLGRCIGALQQIVRIMEDRRGTKETQLACIQTETVARDVLAAIGHLVRS